MIFLQKSLCANKDLKKERGEKRPDRASNRFLVKRWRTKVFLSSIDRGRPKPWTPITTKLRCDKHLSTCKSLGLS